MPRFEKMDIDEIVLFREKIRGEISELKAKFREAGKVLNIKLQEAELVEEYNRLQAKQKELGDKLGMPENQEVGLKALFMRATKG